MTVASFGINHSEDDFRFGIKYNSVRLKFGIPVINKNMIKQEGYGGWVVYNINKEPTDKLIIILKQLLLSMILKFIRKKILTDKI